MSTVAGALVTLMVLVGCPGSGQVDPNALKQSNARLDLAKDFLSKGQLDAAENEARKAIAHHKNNAEAHYVLGFVDMLRGVSSERLLEIEDCLTGVDADALRAEQENHLRSADKHFARSSTLDPEFGEPWASRGIVATLLGNHDQAIEYLSRALELPARLQNIALVRAHLGWAYFHREDYVSATRELLKANQFQPGMCVATYRLGRVYFARKEWQKAEQKFREVADKNCPIQDAHLFLMKTYVRLGVAQTRPQALLEAQNACVAMAPRSCVAVQCRSSGSGASPSAASSSPLSTSATSRDGRRWGGVEAP